MARELRLAAVMLAVMGTPLLAQLPSYPGATLPDTIGALTFGGRFSSLGSCSWQLYGSTWACVGGYNAQFSFGSPAPTPTGPAYDIYCIDFSHHAQPGPYDAFFTNVSTGNLNNTRLAGSLGALDKYKSAAWLAAQFSVNSQVQWRGIHGAIWNIMYGIPASEPAIATWVANANFAATNSYFGFNFSEWSIITQVGSEGNGINDDLSQEYLVHHTTVPEPETLLLLSTGLLAVLAAGVRRTGA